VQKISNAAYEPGLPPSSALRNADSSSVTASAPIRIAEKPHEKRSTAKTPFIVVDGRPYSCSNSQNAAMQPATPMP